MNQAAKAAFLIFAFIMALRKPKEPTVSKPVSPESTPPPEPIESYPETGAGSKADGLVCVRPVKNRYWRLCSTAPSGASVKHMDAVYWETGELAAIVDNRTYSDFEGPEGSFELKALVLATPGTVDETNQSSVYFGGEWWPLAVDGLGEQ